MAKSFLRVSLPTLQWTRTKINIKHPKPLHKDRRIMDAVTKPVFPSMIGAQKRCGLDGDFNAKKSIYDQKTLYDAFLVKQAKKIFESNQLIVAFQPEAVNGRNKTSICNRLGSAGFSTVFYPADILREAIKSSKWRNMEVLLQYQTGLVVCQYPRVKEMLNIIKKIPEFILLGGVVEDVLLTKEGITRYSSLPTVKDLQSELSGVLNTSSDIGLASLKLKQLELIQILAHHSSCSGSQ